VAGFREDQPGRDSAPSSGEETFSYFFMSKIIKMMNDRALLDLDISFTIVTGYNFFILVNLGSRTELRIRTGITSLWIRIRHFPLMWIRIRLFSLIQRGTNLGMMQAAVLQKVFF
jgi:hypothetical protein